MWQFDNIGIVQTTCQEVLNTVNDQQQMILQQYNTVIDNGWCPLTSSNRCVYLSSSLRSLLTLKAIVFIVKVYIDLLWFLRQLNQTVKVHLNSCLYKYKKGSHIFTEFIWMCSSAVEHYLKPSCKDLGSQLWGERHPPFLLLSNILSIMLRVWERLLLKFLTFFSCDY